MNVFASLLMMLLLAAAVYSFMMLYWGVRQSLGAVLVSRIRQVDRLHFALRAIFRFDVPKKLRNYFFLFWFCIACELLVLAVQISIYKNP